MSVASVTDWAPFITALVGVVAAIGALWKYLAERTEQHRVELKERERDREQREIDSLRRFDEKFTSVIGTLGSDEPATQASAAISISLLTFSRDEYRSFRNQVFLILLAILERTKVEQIQYGDVIRKLLIASVEQALPIQLADLQETIRRQERGHRFSSVVNRMDLSRTYLEGINFAELNFHPVVLDVSYSWLSRANMSAASVPLWASAAAFDNADFTAADLVEARFEESLCSGASFRAARLDGATFSRAKLERASFEQASLLGVEFRGATLEGACFDGARFDEAALRAVAATDGWESAEFDSLVGEQLREIATAT